MRRLLFAASAVIPILLSFSGPVAANPPGDYDSNHQWHDSNWWFQNNPNWVYQHHHDWIKANSQWSKNGDWDNHHQWQTKAWFMKNDPSWAHKNHPDWR